MVLIILTAVILLLSSCTSGFDGLELMADGNNEVIERSFRLNEDTSLHIIAQGEGASFDWTPGFIDSYHNDCVEFHLNVGDTVRMYRFVWGSDKVDGKNSNMNGVRFAQGDPDDHSYTFEAAFPLKMLGIKPISTKSLDFDFSICDNDDLSRKAQTAWHSPDAALWRYPDRMGSIATASIMAEGCPVIDGFEDDSWANAPKFRIANVILGSVRDDNDLSATGSICMDDTYLYMFVKVHDDVKKQAAFMFDTAEILDSSGMVVWSIDISRTTHAGGAMKNRRIEDRIELPKGTYVARYTTDESHSAGHWDDTPPSDPFSGLIISR